MTTTKPISDGLSLADFWKRFVTVDTGGSLIRPTPHREQARFIKASDSVDSQGARLFREYFLHWGKKTSKSFMAAVKSVHHLVADPYEREDRLAGIASFDEDQSRIILRQCQQLADRDSWLRRHTRALRTELVFTERVRDERTGGTFTREHVLRALPRDLKGSHGEGWSLIVRDELWTEPDHAFSESLIISPTRKNGEILYLSYYAPRTMMKTGTPFYDLLKRAQAGDDPRLFYSFIGGRGGDASEKVCPWIDESWLLLQEKILAASPARYRRVILNEPSGPDDGLITAAELRDSLSPVAEPDRGQPGMTYWLACDLGVVLDWTAILVGHLDSRSRLVLDAVRTWRGSHLAPVSLVEVQREILALHRRFRFEAVHVDQWQARQMVEQLQTLSVPASIITLDGSTLDQLVTKLKSAFARRLVQIPGRATDLIEQLESVQAVEAGRRRDLLKFQPGTTSGNDATAHDDLAVTLAMLLSMSWAGLGRSALPEGFRACWREQSIPDFSFLRCYIAGGQYVPSGCPSCKACPAHQAVKEAQKRHNESGQTPLPLREFRRLYVADNDYTSMRRLAKWADDIGL